jgi:nucleoside-diphosphate-sugar epimerase
VTLFARIAAALAADPVPVVLTGGGGWLGQATLDLLDQALGPALRARVFVYGAHARELPLRSGRSVECQALSALADYAGAPPLLLHYACATKDRVEGLGVANFLAINGEIRDTVAALIERRGVRGIFLPSSGAVYSPDANPYGMSKLLDEERFAALAGRAGTPLVVARVFNLAGPFINKTDVYALASFLVALIEGRPIEIRARGRVMRSYVHVGDLLLLALGTLLLSPGAAPIHFDTQGETTIEIAALARRAAILLGHREAPIHRATPDGRADDVYVGDGTAMRGLAAALDLPLRHLDTQILDTASYLKGR